LNGPGRIITRLPTHWDGTTVARVSPGTTREAASSAWEAKQNQAKPNKSKQNFLFLFGFIRPNRAFSMGYGESK
jgi:hypothetical protein